MSTTPSTPRLKLHLMRWFVVISVAIFAWSGWRVYAFRSALKQAKALGWEVDHTDPAREIRADWKSAFRKETWTDGVTGLRIPTSGEFEQNLRLVHLLSPSALTIDDASTLRDLSSFSRLTRLIEVSLDRCSELQNLDTIANLRALQAITVTGCAKLTNVDAHKSLSGLKVIQLEGGARLSNVDVIRHLAALRLVSLQDCPRLTNVDALKNLAGLKSVHLDGCTGLKEESIEALRAALPGVYFEDPYHP